MGGRGSTRAARFPLRMDRVAAWQEPRPPVVRVPVVRVPVVRVPVVRVPDQGSEVQPPIGCRGQREATKVWTSPVFSNCTVTVARCEPPDTSTTSPRPYRG